MRTIVSMDNRIINRWRRWDKNRVKERVKVSGRKVAIGKAIAGGNKFLYLAYKTNACFIASSASGDGSADY